MDRPVEQPLDDALDEQAVALVARWLGAAADHEHDRDREAAEQLHELIEDPDGVAFTMQFVDRVIRPDDHAVAAGQLHELAGNGSALPQFLSWVDRILLRTGATLAPRLPWIVMPLARRRMRQIVGHLVVDAHDEALERHLGRRRAEGFALNVNLLGEAVLGEEEAERRLRATVELLADPHIDYVSVKISAIASQLNHWAWEESLDRVADRLRRILRAAAGSDTFVNLDMEEYHDLELTVAAFTAVLDEDEFIATEAGIVLQAYLPDSLPALQHLVGWASARRERGGADIKIRLVKGANLAMERVDAALHGWVQAPYATKHETDANYKRCLDWVLTPERTAAVRIGVGSHNLFDLAWSQLLAEQRGVAGRMGIEMLEGMAPALSRTIRSQLGGLLLYTPIVDPADFDVAISYLFRRLEENAAVGNFMRVIGDLTVDSAAFAAEADRFRRSLADRGEIQTGSRRTVDRTKPPEPVGTAPFTNEPETDAAVAANRRWALEAIRRDPGAVSTALTTTVADVDRILERGRSAQAGWASRSGEERRRLLRAVADELAARRADLVAVMAHEGGKTFAQADPEICEAIDFARYYADRAAELGDVDGATFEPFGVVAVIPPWNFPVAIPAGGMFAALAAGNAVICKPAPETPRCAEVVAECAWAAGVPTDVLQFVRTPEDEVGRRLVTGVDAVVLTGGTDTADLFRSWRPDLRLFAETSGKNTMVITPNADLDLAVKDLVDSAFGHAGQKCSAASLAICVGEVHDSPRFRRQLRDAVESLDVGLPTDPRTVVGPLIGEPNPRLERAFHQLDRAEEWLVAPRHLGGQRWSPGVRSGVRPESWFHRTECFGPVLGLIAAADLDEALAIQNASEFGLTGGIQSLDPAEVDHWLERVEVGNAYVNRHITGAIVQRQPFGGWKRSNVGPGAKAGGPNYVAQLGTWRAVEEPHAATAARWLGEARASDERWWQQEYGVDHDPTALFCEANIFRYRARPLVGMRVGEGVDDVLVDRVRLAAARCGVPLLESTDDEDPAAFVERLVAAGGDRTRVLGPVSERLRAAATEHHVHLADDPVTPSGRVELRHYLREQAISRTLHRFGNLVGAG